ncbi:Hippurate hydrolase [uncultured Gammaproteobacteria bacterium]
MFETDSLPDKTIMPIVNRIAAFHDDMTAWRRTLHAQPELAFEEHRTAEFVARRLAEFGIEVHRGVGGTGVIGVLRGNRSGSGTVGLRADMDALPMSEDNDFAHASQVPGRMHACGHDGHTAMLLGAARYLAETRNFAGTVNFIFQPAEEGHGGAQRMIEDGLFDRFPCDRVFGLHNWPQLPAGAIAVSDGPVMAAADHFEIRIQGKGGHGAMPHHCFDPVVVAAHIITAAQTVVSRAIDPLDSAVISITTIHGGSAFNIIPDRVEMGGTARSFKLEIQDVIESRLRDVVEGTARAMGASATLDYQRSYPATINTAPEAALAVRAAARVVGAEAVVRNPPPSMGAEDFSFMLRQRPGCYIWLGQGGAGHGCMVHNPRYDFNDGVLALGASYWVTLAEQILAGTEQTGEG